MKSAAGYLTRIYDRFLRMYPAGYQREYADEMRVVFQLQVGGRTLTFWQVLRILWGEVRPLPGLLLSAHWRERRKSPMKTGLERWFVQPEGSRKELILAGLPFLMFALPGVFSLFPAMMDLPSPVGITIISLMALILIVVGVIGLFVHLPRWSLVYAGALLTLITLGGLALVANFGNLQVSWGNPLTTLTFLGIHLVALLLIVSGMVWVSGKIPLTARFHEEVKADPSLISLMMYGGTLMVMVANFEDVSGVDWYLIAAAAVMLLGVWGYLRMNAARNQLLALVAGITIAMGLALAANLILVDYGTALVIGILQVERAVFFVGSNWLISLLMLLLPVAVFRGREKPAVG